jgi:hypothetical protein
MGNQTPAIRSRVEVEDAIRQWALNVWESLSPDQQKAQLRKNRKQPLAQATLAALFAVIPGLILLWISFGKDDRGPVARIGDSELARVSNSWPYVFFAGLVLLLAGVLAIFYNLYGTVRAEDRQLNAMTNIAHVKRYNLPLHDEYMAAHEPDAETKSWRLWPYILLGLAVFGALGIVSNWLG